MEKRIKNVGKYGMENNLPVKANTFQLTCDSHTRTSHGSVAIATHFTPVAGYLCSGFISMDY